MPTDRRELLSLHNRVFGTNHTEDYLIWKTEQNPAGFIVSRLALIGGRIVGQYAALPLQMKIGGQREIGYQIVDSMVDPSCRSALGKARMFGLVAQESFADYERQRLPVAFGYPNHFARRYGREVLLYEDIGQLIKYVKPLAWEALAPAGGAPTAPWRQLVWRGLYCGYRRAAGVSRSLVGGVRGETVLQTAAFPEEVQDVGERLIAEYALAVARTWDYLTWRYVRHPVHRYRIYELRDGRGRPQAWLVTRAAEERGRARGYLMEWIVDPQDPAGRRRLAALIRRAENDFRSEDRADRVIAYYLKQDWIAHLLGRLGYFRRPRADEVFLVGRTWNERVPIPMLRNTGLWYSILGDCDGW